MRLEIYQGTVSGTVQDVTLSGSQFRARLLVVKANSGMNFPEYIDTLQADAVLSIPEGHGLALTDGTLVVANSITYKVRTMYDIIMQNEVAVERYALYRDLTAPSQVTGVR